jgi:hypothetical protein
MKTLLVAASLLSAGCGFFLTPEQQHAVTQANLAIIRSQPPPVVVSPQQYYLPPTPTYYPNQQQAAPPAPHPAVRQPILPFIP